MGDMRSVPEPSSAVGSPGTGRDPWAGFGAGPSSRPRRPSGGNGAGDPDDERAVTDLARRLHDRVDGQEALLDRVADLVQHPDDRARVSELRDVTRRVRRDSEALLLLCGADPGVRRGGPQTVPSVLGDAVALADEPARVALRSVPDAALAPAAAVELRHLVAELVDEATAASPGARVEVGGRREPDGALVVEIVVADHGWSDALGGARRGAFGARRLAERLARRSPGGIRLERPLIDQADGLVATLHCPAALVAGPPGGDPWQLSGLSSAPSRPLSPSPLSSASLSSASLSSASSLGPGFSSSMLSADPDAFLLGTTALPVRSGQDELFGPLPAAVGAVGTPIFEAVASAWFRDDERGPAEDDWSSPGDREWRAAAARATRSDTPSTTTTASGLPRRSPGDRLVPPPRTSQQAAATPDERVPERVRDRLSTYQRGLQQGRHRATDAGAQPDPASDGAPEAWTAEGW
jgi:hypothetical protein